MVSMISTIAFYIGITILSMIGLLLVVGAIIAIVALIDFWRVYGKHKPGDEYDNSRDLKRFENSIENEKSTNETNCNKTHIDTTYTRGVFGKLHDISVMALWVIISAIWYVIICIIGFFGICYDCISACFKQKN